MEAQKKPTGKDGQSENEQGKVKIFPQFAPLTPEKIKSHIKEITSPPEGTPPKQILSKLLNKIERVNFRKEAGLEPEQNIKAKHYLIISVEKLLKIAAANNWGIARQNDMIFVFNGKYWDEIDKNDFIEFLGKAAEKMGVETFEARYYGFREQLFRQFTHLANFTTPEPPEKTILINLKNGTFEISPDGTRLKPFDRNDFLRYQLPFDYTPGATAPKFEQYLNEVLPDEEKQNILSEFLGYVFIHPKALKLEKTLLLYGSGSNGKSVFFDIVNSLLGDENISTFSLSSLTNENGYFRAKIGSKLLNYASEISGNLETSYFKQLVSGEPVEARLPYGEPFTIKNYAKLCFNLNELPREVEHTHAYFRRFLIIGFDVTIPDERQNPNLAKEIISDELPGVFNWVLGGVNRLLTNKGFSKCEAARLQVEKYRIESDTVRTFIDEFSYTPSANNHELLKDVYGQYRQFCIEDGYKPLNKTNFSRRLQNLNFIKERLTEGNVFYMMREEATAPY
jgi:putative DNA primase/helicase